MNVSEPETLSVAEIHRLIVENSAFGLVLTDLGGIILYANPRQCETSGYTLDELVGRNARLFQSGATPADTYRDLWDTILAGDIWRGDLLNRRKNGDTVKEYVRISPVRNADGNVHCFLAIKEEQLAGHQEPGAIGRVAIDALTGLPNRASLEAQLRQLATGNERDGDRFALILLNVDHFRDCNEAFGQIVADQMLLEIVARLSAGIRSRDLLARVGGDEFALVLNALDDETTCAEMARRILDSLGKPIRVDGHTREFTGSIGIARYPGDARDGEGLLQNAELALGDAKRSGGDGFRFFRPALNAGLPMRQSLTEQLRHVVQRGELVLHYQPQLSLVSGHVVGVEALVRWQHPDRGLIAPNAFIPVAEESGLIIPISEWVLNEACRQVRVWIDAGLPPLRVAVNLSARHFRFSSLPETVARVLADNQIEAKYLELELTESAMMQDASKAVRIVDRLKNLGARISLDDFGTGYSSLAYLSRFAIDRLKIDQSFVRDITTNPVNASIATATIAMAHKLGKIVVAEGVETESQMQFLRRHDCDEMQGFLFSKPVTAENLATLLSSGAHLSFDTAHAESPQNTLLLVDDEQNILNALRRLFRREGYRVLTATSGAEGLELLALNHVQVVISDQRMPEMTGVEFLSRVKDLYPDTVRLVLSGYSELSSVTGAINRGAIWRYISKPWDDEALLQDVRSAFLSLRKE